MEFRKKSHKPTPASYRISSLNKQHRSDESAHQTEPIININSSERSRKSRLLWLVGIIIGILLLIAIAYKMYAHGQNGGLGPAKSDRYQAVFLTNNQVYFGKLAKADRDTYRLSDAYYFQNQQGENQDSKAQDSAAQKSQQTLVKLGQNEIHGPENELFIPREQVSYWENLRSDAKVVDAIKEQKKQ